MAYRYFVPMVAPPPKAMRPRAPDPDAPDVPRHESGHVNVGKFLAMKARPKWMEEARRVRDDLHKNKADFPKQGHRTRKIGQVLLIGTNHPVVNGRHIRM